MMRKKISWLFLLTVFLSLFSCRNDLLPEQDMNSLNNSSKFLLTSKRISLSESKHKVKLLPELEKVKLGFQAKNSAGKVVQYGNGVSINTDDVIYIENGPDYHTYTFRIDRQNAPADAPIENLVLTPLPDGSYKELLVSYNLTIQEKQSLALGKVIDTEGKTTVTELAAGTFNGNGQLSGKSSVSCGWESETIWQACYTGEHNQSNWQTWNECDWATHNGTPPKVYTIVVYRCHSVITADDHGSTGGGDYDPSGGGASAGSESSTPCTFATAYTQPQHLGLSSSPCPEGVPTEPNMGEPETPCEKVKPSIDKANAILKNPTVKAQMDAALKGKADAPNEWAVAVGLDIATGNYMVEGPNEGTPTTSNFPSANLGNKYIASGHSHAKKRGSPSALDLYSTLQLSQVNYLNYRQSYVYGINNGSVEVYALVITDKDLAGTFFSSFPKSENYDDATHWFKKESDFYDDVDRITTIYKHNNISNNSGENHNDYALALAYILDKHNAGISLAKVDANGNLKKVNVSIEQTTTNGFPDEKIVVSKCP